MNITGSAIDMRLANHKYTGMRREHEKLHLHVSHSITRARRSSFRANEVQVVDPA